MDRREFVTLLSTLWLWPQRLSATDFGLQAGSGKAWTPDAVNREIDARLARTKVDYAAVLFSEPRVLHRMPASQRASFLEKLHDSAMVSYLDRWRRKGLLRLRSAPVATAAKGLLLELRLEEVMHEVATCLDHFLGVHEILLEWGHPEAIADIGLFHAIYGTEANVIEVLDPKSSVARARVRAIIGSESERGVFLFGRVEPTDFLLQTIDSGKPAALARDFESCDGTRLSLRDFVALSEVLVANSLEPYRAVAEASILSRLRQFEGLRPYLSRGAQQAIGMATGPKLSRDELAESRLCPKG